MKKEIHPDYHPVIYYDTSCEAKFLINSTFTSKETMKWDDGNEYPVCRLEISSESHPVYTGEKRVAQDKGRVAKFKSRYGKQKATPSKTDKPK